MLRAERRLVMKLRSHGDFFWMSAQNVSHRSCYVTDLDATAEGRGLTKDRRINRVRKREENVWEAEDNTR